jgi:hypothetical protein
MGDQREDKAIIVFGRSLQTDLIRSGSIQLFLIMSQHRAKELDIVRRSVQKHQSQTRKTYLMNPIHLPLVRPQSIQCTRTRFKKLGVVGSGC